jgi:hypothetical protein
VKTNINMPVLLVSVILTIVMILPGCASEVNSSQRSPVRSLSASPTTDARVFRSAQFYLTLQLPRGWAGAEGPESLARSKIKGQVALNSWGQKDFWAREISKDNGEAYDPQTILSQVPSGGAYVVLDEIVTLAAPPGNESAEYTLNDLSGLITPHDWRQDASSQAQIVNFFKWGRILQFYIACRSDASDATVTALNNLLQSWKFDEILAGDPGWAFTLARQLLPEQVGPAKFPRKGGTAWDQNVARAMEVDVRQDKTVHFRFTYYWNLQATPGPSVTPSEIYHWWEIDVPASGQAVLSAQGGTPLSADRSLPSTPSAASSQPRNLTDLEKQKVVQIAFNIPQALAWLQGRNDYRVSNIDWYAINVQDGKVGSWGTITQGTDGDWSPPPFPSEPVSYYPGVTIAVGEDTIYQMQIAVDLEAEKTVMVNGPYVSLDSPSRFSGMKPPPITTASPENPLTKTMPLNQSVIVNGITLTLEQVVITTAGFNFTVLYTPTGYDPTAGMPSNIPGAMAEYSLDGGPTKELVSPPPFSLGDKAIEWTWISDASLSPDASELTVRITSVGKQSGLWEFKVQLSQS